MRHNFPLYLPALDAHLALERACERMAATWAEPRLRDVLDARD